MINSLEQYSLYFVCFSFLFSLKQNLAKYDWPLTEVDNNKLNERLTSRQGGHIGISNSLHTNLGVLSRQSRSKVSLGSYAGECLGNLDLCKNGLSLSFWINYNGK